ncbi:DUF503 domain-containing protein [Gracilibacillus caseinilyticus]|uniref:DUF503 domain-containing protein n=1 Tax=Gracilibacillus caseinilyticus TaxID=2932256 RepID=A0ABY4EUD0_9BACI|nr:DUF503 domain-containing protein [Gracilibacillus caseinilyticus]UOQ47833.1 DUF503 domain-containing protein [Gracilibacillus caseinilyticus]
MITYAEVEFILYECHSLKDKRSVLKRIQNRLKKQLNVAIAEIDYQDLWQRSKFAIVTVTTTVELGEQVMQQACKVFDSFTEIERTITNVEIR